MIYLTQPFISKYGKNTLVSSFSLQGAPQFPVQYYGPNGEMVITAENPYGTLGPGGRLVMTAASNNGSDATLMHLGEYTDKGGVCVRVGYE